MRALTTPQNQTRRQIRKLLLHPPRTPPSRPQPAHVRPRLRVRAR
jgi:hypothetical protein